MSKKPLDLEALTSRHSVRVRFCETDLMGIVHHANYLVYCEEARVHWLKQRGVSYESWARQGVHLPVVEASSRFRKPAHFDDALEIATTVTSLTRAAVRFGYRITRGDTLLCECETLLACVDDSLKVRRFPEDVMTTLSSPELASA